MYKIIDGKDIAEKVKDEIVKEITALKSGRPNLAIILVGNRPDSRLYVSLKEKEGFKVGVDTHLYELDENATEAELLSIINFLNSDDLIDGILIQLPLPSHFNTDVIIRAIKPEKDVDGFHPEHPSYILSPVLASIQACINHLSWDKKDRTAVVFYNSEIFAAGVRDILIKNGFEVLENSEAQQADLVVSALGKPRIITKEKLKEGAVIIDIGITKDGKKVKGDVDLNSVKEWVSYLTPVPGGIGPMTIAFLFKNVLEIYKRRANK